jgi:hypothetical protein
MRQDQVEEVLKRLQKEISSVSSSSLMRAFQSVDKDKNGYLEAPEFAKCLGQFKITLPPAALQALVSMFDVNGDGGISYAEFNAVMSGNAGMQDGLREAPSYGSMNGSERPPSASRRPPSASKRPQSANPRVGTPNRLTRVPTPQQMDKFFEANSAPITAKERIYGFTGPRMTGVISYPYSASQRLYRDDFEQIVASTITHPYCRTTSKSGSLPHNILSGTNFDEASLGAMRTMWRSEHERSFTPMSLVEAKQIKATGVRSECTQFLA